MDRSKEARKARKAERATQKALKGQGATSYKARQRGEKLHTSLLIAVVSLVGIALIAWAVVDDRNPKSEDNPTPEATPTELASENSTENPSDEEEQTDEDDSSEEPEERPTPSATEVVVDDPEAPMGQGIPFSMPATVSNAPVACGGEEPDNAGAVRNIYPGGPAGVMGSGDWVAEIETSCGTIVVDLLEDSAPQTVNSYVFLAKEGFFDGLEIFRNATSIGALQTGSGTNDATWKIGYTLPDELELAHEEGYEPGVIAMANAGPNTGGSQFFFVYNDSFNQAFTTEESRAYSVFGKTIDGLPVLEKIGDIAAEGETPSQRVYIEKVTARPATPEEIANKS